MIRIENLSKTYKSKKGASTLALDNINLKFGAKGMVFIVGKSGSGKSTLLNLLGGLDLVTSGKILVNDKDISTFSSKEYDSYRNTYIGFVFQEFNILEEYNVYENISLALELQNIKPNKNDLDKLLDKLGISKLGNRKVNELSGGEKQRVAIARALIKNPEIILADEPTGNLDKNSSAQIFGLLKEISKEKLVIVVSHDIESAKTYADRIVEIEDGKIKNDLDTLTEGEMKSFKLKKSKLPNLFALKMSLANFRYKPFKLIMTIILTTFSLIFMGITINFYMFDKNLFITNTMRDNNNYVYDVKNTKFFYSFGMLDSMDLKLTLDDLKNIEPITKSKVSAIYYLYDNNKLLEFEFGPNEIENTNNFYWPIGSPYFVDVKDTRLLNNIIGSIPVNSNEIVVHKYFADYAIKFGIKLVDDTLYFPKDYNDLLNSRKEIRLGNNSVIITGIIDDNDTLYKEAKETGQFKSRSLEQYFRENYREKGEYVYGIGLIDNIILNEDKLSVLDSTTLTTRVGLNEIYVSRMVPFKVLDSEISVINENGNSSVSNIKKEEVLISLDSLKEVYGELNGTFDNNLLEFIKNNADLTYDEALVKFVSDYLKEHSNLTLTLHNYAEEKQYSVRVKGITLDNTNYVSYDYVNDSNIKTKEIISARVYDDNINNLKSTFNKLIFRRSIDLDDVGTFYTFTLDHLDDLGSIISIYKYLSKYILIVSLVFVLFNILLFSNFIAVTISYSKKQIGILRALGAKAKDVTKIFSFEALIIGLISWVLSIIGFIVICNLLNNSIFGSLYYTLNGIVKNPFIPIIMLVYTVLISLLITLISTSKVTKIKPIDAILNK